MTVSFVSVLFVASALIAVGAFVAAWRRELTSALAGVPVMLAGAGTAFAGISRFASTEDAQLIGQEMAVLLAIVALAAVALGIGIAGREAPR
jgi:NADH:ubiquinone oxidoreductase subunit K